MKEAIRTIHDAEVIDFFRSVGVLNKLERGELRCAVCAEPLTIQTFQAAARLQGKLTFCCNRPSCYASFILQTRRSGQ